MEQGQWWSQGAKESFVARRTRIGCHHMQNRARRSIVVTCQSVKEGTAPRGGTYVYFQRRAGAASLIC